MDAISGQKGAHESILVPCEGGEGCLTETPNEWYLPQNQVKDFGGAILETTCTEALEKLHADAKDGNEKARAYIEAQAEIVQQKAREAAEGTDKQGWLTLRNALGVTVLLSLIALVAWCVLASSEEGDEQKKQGYAENCLRNSQWLASQSKEISQTVMDHFGTLWNYVNSSAQNVWSSLVSSSPAAPGELPYLPVSVPQNLFSRPLSHPTEMQLVSPSYIPYGAPEQVIPAVHPPLSVISGQITAPIGREVARYTGSDS